MVKAMDKVIDKGKKIAAHLLEAAEADIEFEDGKFTRRRHRQERRRSARSRWPPTCRTTIPLDELEPGLDETAFYDPKNFTYPGGCHIAEVEIDPETGVTQIVNFTAVDDFGRVINPMIVEGQVHGGVAQGIGQALLESAASTTRDGQLLTGSYHGLHHAARRRPADRSASAPTPRCARTIRSA